ncbi:DNA-directed RNA polymerase [Brevundimonas naejangsanensis]|uniref:DNA-directed RNA polymerase n=1 Tax=Brevundimonas naejangsanensis TaxID=588932 RepID=UPI0026ED09EB|nr:DNA-directed RNA polymerase [Brevundimonas naejangsanensis]
MNTETYRQKVVRQIDLENESRALGASRYRANRPMPWRNETRAADEEADLPPGRQLLKLATEPTAAAIREFCERVDHGGAARGVDAHLILSQIGADEAAYLTGRVALDAAATGMKFTATCIAVANAFIEHIQMESLRHSRKDVFKGLIRSQQNASSLVTSKKRKAIKNIMVEHGVDQTFTLQQRVRAGAKALELFCDSTGLFVIDSIARGTKVIRPTEAVHRWLEQQHARCELLEPMHLPMIVPPRRWTTPFRGGYVTKTPGARLVKQTNAAYHEHLRTVEMPGVYSAVNAIQSTAWMVNRPVLDVIREIWDGGGVLGGLPNRQPLDLPPRPPEFAHDEQVKARWKREAADIHDLNSANLSKRLAISQRLWVAEKFADEEAIYFPHSVDFRGRVYPIPSAGPNPQGDDICKALLTFAEGHPITDAGAGALAVHIAGLFGVDKVSLDDRMEWFWANEHLILDSATNPLDGARFWAEADSPFMALAACFEWAGYIREGADFISHLPISLDGSNSGLQHFSAMLRDPVGAKAVNLMPDTRPQDIYSDVAAKAQALADQDDDERSLPWRGGLVTRKVAKRPCMTFTYSATRFGMTDMIYQTLRELDASGQPHLGSADNYASSLYLSYTLWDAISETVVAASTAMAWLREAAKVMTAAGQPIWWTTPTGLPVLQTYAKRRASMVKVFHKNKMMRVKLQHAAPGIDGQRQVNGISPNFIHSMDAAHLMAVANACHEAGILDLSVVHDSFGVHAARVYELRSILRETFADQYSVDRLAMLRDELIAQLPEAFADKLPPLPTMGDFDINEVRRSDYLFH